MNSEIVKQLLKKKPIWLILSTVISAAIGVGAVSIGLRRIPIPFFVISLLSFGIFLIRVFQEIRKKEDRNFIYDPLWRSLVLVPLTWPHLVLHLASL